MVRVSRSHHLIGRRGLSDTIDHFNPTRMLYIIALTLGFGLAYPLLAYFFQYFFGGDVARPRLSPRHLIITFSFLVIVLGLVFLIPDAAFANRIQHAFGGGFVIMMLSYFSLQATRVQIRRFQFFVLSLMIASCFGIVNELLESIMQV
jgi:hypothetical protein